MSTVSPVLGRAGPGVDPVLIGMDPVIKEKLALTNNIVCYGAVTHNRVA